MLIAFDLSGETSVALSVLILAAARAASFHLAYASPTYAKYAYFFSSGSRATREPSRRSDSLWPAKPPRTKRHLNSQGMPSLASAPQKHHPLCLQRSSEHNPPYQMQYLEPSQPSRIEGCLYNTEESQPPALWRSP